MRSNGQQGWVESGYERGVFRLQGRIYAFRDVIVHQSRNAGSGGHIHAVLQRATGSGLHGGHHQAGAWRRDPVAVGGRGFHNRLIR